MSTPTRRLAALGIASALALAALPGVAAAAGGTVVTVNSTDLGVHWAQETLATGTGAFEAGPGTPPLGHGSYAMRALTPDDKVTLVTDLYTGQPLSAISGLDYWTYRDATSTSPTYIAPSINIAIFTNAEGPGTGFATLVFEPLYAYGNGAIQDGVWQHWDTFAPTQTGFAGGWWSTRQVGAFCAFTCYADFATLLTNAPAATILSVGVNLGRGPASFIGAVDGLSVTAVGTTTTFDFEDLSLDKDGCKDGGWTAFHAPTFKNQGDCVSFFASAGRQGPKSTVAAAAAIRGHERAAARRAATAATTERHPTKTGDAGRGQGHDATERAHGRAADHDTPAASSKAKGKGH